MPEFIPLSLILQAHTIPAIKKNRNENRDILPTVVCTDEKQCFHDSLQSGKRDFFREKTGGGKVWRKKHKASCKKYKAHILK